MSFKQVAHPDLGVIKIYKRRGNKSMRLSLSTDGTIRLSLPLWVPYSSGIAFIKSRREWLESHRQSRDNLLRDKQRVGRLHTLFLVETKSSNKPSSRIYGNSIFVNYPSRLITSDKAVQSQAHTAVKRALRKEANELLPQRLSQLSNQHQLKYNTVRTRILKSRWGSCSQADDISLNIYLILLPQHLIDYVLIHELIHTKEKNHSPKFWLEFEKVLPGAKKLRKEIRNFQPSYI